MADRSNRRQDIYKNKDRLKPEEIRRRRGEAQITLRRQKREENLLKKRNLNNELNSSDSESEDERTFNLDQKLVSELYDQDFEVVLQATTAFRKLLSKEKNPPIEDVIRAGVVPRLVALLNTEHTLIQFEAAWALTNIASGTSAQTIIVMESGAVPIFVKLLSSPVADVREQAVWALGNISGDSPVCRDYVLEQGALAPLISIFDEDHKISMLRNASWTLSNFCRGKNPSPPWDKIQPAINTLAKLVYSEDSDIVTDACWGLSYLTDGSNDKIQKVLETGVARRLCELLMNPNTTLQTPALRSIGNIVTGDDVQTQIVINCGALEALHFLLSSKKESIRKEACWTISNITAGNINQVLAVISSGLIPPLVEILSHGDFKSQKEACWAISNATTSLVQNPDAMTTLVNFGIIQPLCDILYCQDVKIIQVALDALENILKVGEFLKSQAGYNPFISAIEEARGIDKLNELQVHESPEVFQKAFSLLETYFKEDEMDDAMPGVIDEATGQFAFDSSMSNGEFRF